MVGVAERIDHILDALRTDALGKLDQLACLGGEGQGVNQHAAFGRHHETGVDFDIL